MGWFGKWFGGQTGASSGEATKVDTGWRIVQVTDGEGRVSVLRIVTVRAQEAREYQLAVEIAWRFEGFLPPSDVNTQQLTFERALDELSAENGFATLVQVSTGSGVKEWLFYTSNRDRFMGELNRLLEGHEPYPLEINFYEDPDWQVWSETVNALKLRAH